MIIAGHLLLPDDDRPGHVRLSPGHLRLDGEQIAEVVEGEMPNTCDAGGPDALITPGFIDTHLHLPQFDTIGAHGLPLLEWLDGVTFPAERRWEDTGYARAMTQRVVGQLLAHGTTGICAYATVHHDATHAALQVARDAGLRGVIGQTLIERNAPDFLSRPASQLLDETARLLEAFPSSGRVAAAVTPRFAVTCTAGFMAEMGKLAAEHHAFIQSHLAETVPECELIAELFDGTSYVDVYGNAGLLTPRSVYGHGIYLDEADQRTLAETGTIIAHCPTANSFLRSGTMDRRSHLDHDVRTTLGSDIGGGYERSMVRVGRAMIEAAASFHEREVDTLPNASQVWWQITTGNAEALGWPGGGRLAAGASADVVVVQPNIPWHNSAVDPLERLMWSWDDRWVQRTIARGQTAYPSTG
ncbi:amidohydrolase family protein [Algisphaera agarilytica]|uniref:Guanine deaminase n=1 Tax=Algisphaera agarilytica TaxID=1385975 RepID=A0A7X0H5B0_9BACT|nr:amidohydrolase family protein [Algisphaera agarilytica]MBB6429566.1 guanine deaminase [Algisphaera agarilytica]